MAGLGGVSPDGIGGLEDRDGPEVHVTSAVALVVAVSEHSLYRGQVGTVVEQLDSDAFEVEFADNEGQTYATAAPRASQILVLCYEPSKK